MADTITTTMDSLVDCVCAALADIERAACACGLTVGPPAAGPFACGCECATGDGVGGQVSAFLERVYPAEAATFEQVTRLEDCRPGAVAADITVVVTRCYPTLDNQGNQPTLDDTSLFADNLNTDLVAAWNALKCCGYKIGIRESAIDADPEGGCSAFAIRVTTLVAMTAPTVPDVS
jgi:hypothetical protein